MCVGRGPTLGRCEAEKVGWSQVAARSVGQDDLVLQLLGMRRADGILFAMVCMQCWIRIGLALSW